MELKYVVVVIVMKVVITQGIRFEIDREECLSHNVDYEGDTLHLSFVVVKSDTPWHLTDDGVHLLVFFFFFPSLSNLSTIINYKLFKSVLCICYQIKGPSGEKIHEIRDKISEKYNFVVRKRGVYRFCFTNKSPYHETIDFDVQVAHFAVHDQHAKDGEAQVLIFKHYHPLKNSQ